MQTRGRMSPGWWKDLLRVVGGVVFVAVLTAVAVFTPVREWLNVERIEVLARSLGWFGPLLILVVGTLAPLFLVPRWPVSWLCGVLYGVVWGSVLGCVSATLGAWLQFHFARTLLRPMARRVAARFRWAEKSISKDRMFTAVLLLRLFPLSHFAAVNLIAGTLGGHLRAFLLATSIGILPTSIMFAAFGKLAREPSLGFTILVTVCLFVFTAVGVVAFFVMRRRTRSQSVRDA